MKRLITILFVVVGVCQTYAQRYPLFGTGTFNGLFESPVYYASRAEVMLNYGNISDEEQKSKLFNATVVYPVNARLTVRGDGSYLKINDNLSKNASFGGSYTIPLGADHNISIGATGGFDMKSFSNGGETEKNIIARLGLRYKFNGLTLTSYLPYTSTTSGKDMVLGVKESKGLTDNLIGMGSYKFLIGSGFRSGLTPAYIINHSPIATKHTGQLSFDFRNLIVVGANYANDQTSNLYVAFLFNNFDIASNFSFVKSFNTFSAISLSLRVKFGSRNQEVYSAKKKSPVYSRAVVPYPEDKPVKEEPKREPVKEGTRKEGPTIVQVERDTISRIENFETPIDSAEYFLVLGALASKENANKFLKVKQQEFSDVKLFYDSLKKYYYVGVDVYGEINLERLMQLQKKYKSKDAWFMRVETMRSRIVLQGRKTTPALVASKSKNNRHHIDVLALFSEKDRKYAAKQHIVLTEGLADLNQYSAKGNKESLKYVKLKKPSRAMHETIRAKYQMVCHPDIATSDSLRTEIDNLVKTVGLISRPVTPVTVIDSLINLSRELTTASSSAMTVNKFLARDLRNKIADLNKTVERNLSDNSFDTVEIRRSIKEISIYLKERMSKKLSRVSNQHQFFYASISPGAVEAKADPILDYFFSNTKPRVVYLYVNKLNHKKQEWDSTTERYKVYYTTLGNQHKGKEYWKPINSLASITCELFLPSQYAFKMQDNFTDQAFEEAWIETVDMSATLEHDKKFTRWFKAAYKTVLHDKSKRK